VSCCSENDSVIGPSANSISNRALSLSGSTRARPSDTTLTGFISIPLSISLVPKCGRPITFLRGRAPGPRSCCGRTAAVVSRSLRRQYSRRVSKGSACGHGTRVAGQRWPSRLSPMTPTANVIGANIDDVEIIGHGHLCRTIGPAASLTPTASTRKPTNFVIKGKTKPRCRSR